MYYNFYYSNSFLYFLQGDFYIPEIQMNIHTPTIFANVEPLIKHIINSTADTVSEKNKCVNLANLFKSRIMKLEMKVNNTKAELCNSAHSNQLHIDYVHMCHGLGTYITAQLVLLSWNHGNTEF